MEYEIDDGETMLFDKSTNPSLLQRRASPRSARLAQSPHPRGRRKGARALEREGRRA